MFQIRQKSFVRWAPPGLAGGAYSSPPDTELDHGGREGKEEMEGQEGREEEERAGQKDKMGKEGQVRDIPSE